MSQSSSPNALAPAENRPESSVLRVPSSSAPLASTALYPRALPPWASRKNDCRDRYITHRTSPSSRSLLEARPSPSALILLRPTARSRSRSSHHPKSQSGHTSDRHSTSGVYSHRCAATCREAAAALCGDDVDRDGCAVSPIPPLAAPAAPTCSSTRCHARFATSRESAGC